MDDSPPIAEFTGLKRAVLYCPTCAQPRACESPQIKILVSGGRVSITFSFTGALPLVLGRGGIGGGTFFITSTNDKFRFPEVSKFCISIVAGSFAAASLMHSLMQSSMHSVTFCAIHPSMHFFTYSASAFLSIGAN